MLPVRRDKLMKFNKDDIYSIIGSILFHLIIFILLWFMVLRSVIPGEEGGILVNFGNIDLAAGTFEPRYTGNTLPTETTLPPPTTPTNESADEEVLTQNIEESVAVDEEKKKQEEDRRLAEERERVQREEAERRRQEEEQRLQREESIRNRVAGAFGTGQADDANQGSANAGSGNQGSPFGNSDQGENEGVGGYGSFNLNGRSIGAGGLPRPDYTIQEEGRIVINITVNPNGDVISTEIGRGTNIDNLSMRNSAMDAARRAKFNRISGTNNQTGTITYRYSLR